MGPRMAKRRATTKRARKKLLVTTSMLAVLLYSFGSIGAAHASQPGSLVLTDGTTDYPLCFPVAAVTIRVGALASGGKSNIVRATWTGGGITSDWAPYEIDATQYADLGRDDTITVTWEAQQGPGLGSWTATLTATLSWVLPNANEKEVADVTASREC